MDTDTRPVLIIPLRAVDCRSLQLAQFAQDCIGVRIFSRWHRPKCNHMSSAASCRSGHLLCEFGPDAKMKQERVKRGSTTQNKLHVSTSALCITSTTSLKKKKKYAPYFESKRCLRFRRSFQSQQPLHIRVKVSARMVDVSL